MKRGTFIALLALVFGLNSCGSSRVQENQILLLCAASLGPVLQEIKSHWEKDHIEKIIINSASSGILARQIEHGAHADMFISANKTWMHSVIRAIEVENNPRVVASNRLAAVVPLHSKLDSLDFNQLLQAFAWKKEKVSIGDPGHVPLGQYTMQSMEYYGIYDALSPNQILAKDARNALLLVELGEASLGFVYLSDAISSKKVKIISIIPAKSHQPINYEMIVLNNLPPQITEFSDFLLSDEAVVIWRKHGFTF